MNRAAAIGGMLLALIVLYMVAPQTAMQFALVILLISIGYGMQAGKFNFKGA